MFENWFDQINFFLHTHPDMLAQLAFLFRVKCWLLTLLMGYFLYLIYKDQKDQAKSRSGKAKASARFEA
jgi:hypothetical protein